MQREKSEGNTRKSRGYGRAHQTARQPLENNREATEEQSQSHHRGRGRVNNSNRPPRSQHANPAGEQHEGNQRFDRRPSNNSTEENFIEGIEGDDSWVKEPTVQKMTSNERQAPLSLIVSGKALIDPANIDVVEPQGVIGAGLASQMLIDAPYFFTEPNPSKEPMSPVYNLTHYYSPMAAAKKYMVNRVIKTLLSPKCTYHERFALEVYKQDACRHLINEIKSIGYNIPDKGKPQPDQYMIIKDIREELLKSLNPFVKPLVAHYIRVRDFAQRDIRIPSLGGYFRPRGRNNKEDDFQKILIEWLAAVTVELSAAEERLQIARNAGDQSVILQAYIDVLITKAIEQPMTENIKRQLYQKTGEDSENDDEEEEAAGSKRKKYRKATKHIKSPTSPDPNQYVKDPIGAYHRGLMSNGSKVATAMKGWFGPALVFGPRRDRKARRDRLRECGELAPISKENEDEDSEGSNNDADDPTTEVEVIEGVNIHRKMIYFHTVTIDPTLAASNPSIKLPEAKDKRAALDDASPQSAVSYLRRLRSAEASAEALHFGLEKFREHAQVRAYLQFNKSVKCAGIDDLDARIKQFDVRLGSLHVKEGAANELRVWRDNIPRIISQVITPRYVTLLNAIFSESSLNEKDMGDVQTFVNLPPNSDNDGGLATSLSSYFNSLEKGDPSRSVAFWVIKCQRMLLTDAEATKVKSDPRFARMHTFLQSISDSQTCKLYKTSNVLGIEEIPKREKGLKFENDHICGSNNDPEEGQTRATDKATHKLSLQAAFIRQNILTYLAFWIHCDLLNCARQAKSQPTVPFFHFVTVSTKYGVNVDPERWAHVGELDGLLIDLSPKVPQILNVFEIKANVADLTGAWKQRDRFLSSVWNAYCRPAGESFIPPLHQNWYSMAGTVPKSGAVDTPNPGVVSDICSPSQKISPGELIIYPSVSTSEVLPPFYQLIFPLLSFNVSVLFQPNSSPDDSGTNCTPSMESIEKLRTLMTACRNSQGLAKSTNDTNSKAAAEQKYPSQPPPVTSDAYKRMLGMWIFTSFIVVTKQGDPIIPSWRLLGMGPFRHTLCHGAAVIYASGRKNTLIETWFASNSKDGTLGKLAAAKQSLERESLIDGKQVIGPWLKEITERKPKDALSKHYFGVPNNVSFVFSSVFFAIKSQRSKHTNCILCPQELVSELSRNNFMTSLLLIPKFENDEN